MADIKHPITELTIKPVNRRKRAIQIGNLANGKAYVLVSYAFLDAYTYCIYNCYGYLALPIIFHDLDDAIKTAEWFEQTYKEFFPIWDEYEEANIPKLAQWTIKNGVNVYKVIQSRCNVA